MVGGIDLLSGCASYQSAIVTNRWKGAKRAIMRSRFARRQSRINCRRFWVFPGSAGSANSASNGSQITPLPSRYAPICAQ